MGSILDVKRFSDLSPKKKSHRRRRHSSPPQAFFSPKHRTVKTKRQAYFALFIIFIIFLSAIAAKQYIGAVVIFALVFIIVILPILFRKMMRSLRTRQPHSQTNPPPITNTREYIPSSIKQQVYARARGRCERPRCSYSAKLHIHHIDKNPSNNSPFNLLVVCPNCHARIHDGEFSIDAQRSWITF